MAQEQEEKIFADGFIFKRNEKAPEFVIGRMSIKVEDAVAFLKQHQDKGWVNLGVKQARSGNYYIELDTFKPKGDDSAVDKYEKTTKTKQQPTQQEEEDSDLPF
jgi:hypothetical protein